MLATVVAHQVAHMKKTVVGLITPHVLAVIDVATKEQTGANVDWHLKDAVTKTVDEFGHQYNARDLLTAYIHGLETAAQEAGKGRMAYVNALREAVAAATKRLNALD